MSTQHFLQLIDTSRISFNGHKQRFWNREWVWKITLENDLMFPFQYQTHCPHIRDISFPVNGTSRKWIFVWSVVWFHFRYHNMWITTWFIENNTSMCGNMEFIFPHYIYKWDLYFRIIYIYIYIWIYISPLYIYIYIYIYICGIYISALHILFNTRNKCHISKHPCILLTRTI